MHYKRFSVICQILGLILLFLNFLYSFVLAQEPPQVRYEITLNPETRNISGKVIFRLPPKKLYLISLASSRLTNILVKDALHQLKSERKDQLLSFYPLRSEGLLELHFEREFTLQALLEGEYLPNPFPYLMSDPFTFDIILSVVSLKKPLKFFIPADYSSESSDNGVLRLKFISKTPVKVLPPLLIGPYRKDLLNLPFLNLSFLSTDKGCKFLRHLKDQLARIINRIEYVNFKFKNLYLTCGLEEMIWPGLVILSTEREYSAEQLITMLLQQELKYGKGLTSQTLITGLSIFLGEHELSSDKANFRKKLLLTESEKSFAFYRIYELAQQVGEETFKLSALEFLSQKMEDETFLKRFRLEEIFPSEVVQAQPQRELKAHLDTELFINIKPFSGPLTLEVLIESEEGSTLKKINLKNQQERIPLQLPSSFKRLVLDPYYKLYRRPDPQEIPRNFESLKTPPLRVILPERNLIPLYQPLINYLRDEGAKLEIEPSEPRVFELPFTENLLYLHQPPPDYFVDLPKKGFYFKVLPHPKNPRKSIAFCRTESPKELSHALKEIKTWANATEVEIRGGKLKMAKALSTQMGLSLTKDTFFGLKVQHLSSIDDILPQLLSARVILVGEDHTEYAHHLFQLQIIQKIFQYYPKLTIGVEMIQRPFQRELDRFTEGKIPERDFLQKTEYFDRWGYDWQLYRDIFLWAQRNQIKMVALDLPRELVKKVYKEGLKSLTDKERLELPETDFQHPEGYKHYLRENFKLHEVKDNSTSFENFYRAQILRDEGMAETLVIFLNKHPETKVIVLVGNGHILNRWGLFYALNKRLKEPIISIILGETTNFTPALGDYFFNPYPVPYQKTPQLGIILEETPEGLLIKEIKPNTPAEKADLRPKDLILSVNGEKINKVSHLKLILTFVKRDEMLILKIRRQDHEREIRLKIF